MNPSDKVQITIQLSRIDRDNFKCKVKNGKYKKMQYLLEHWIKSHIKEESHVVIEKTRKSGIEAPYFDTL